MFLRRLIDPSHFHNVTILLHFRYGAHSGAAAPSGGQIAPAKWKS
jgi:hypothetical protein